MGEPWRPWLASIAGLAAICLAAGCATRPSRVASTLPPPQPYLRVGHSTNGITSLEVALRSLTPIRGNGPIIWLVGVSHLGAADYYTQLQRFLDSQPVVLFEGVGATNKRFQLRESGEYSLQEELARALGLEFQLNTVQYDRPNFRNSDLSLTDLQRLLSGTTNSLPTDAVPATSRNPDRSELGQLVQVMQGTGLLGGLARLAVSIVSSSPRLQATVKVAMIEVLGQMPDDLSGLAGLPPGFRRLLRVLIEERNQTVVRDVAAVLRERPRPRSVAVFYGAGHMVDLERRLRDTLKYAPAEERWLTAFAVSPRESGLSAFELGLIRSYLRGQLSQLRTEGTNRE